MDGTTLAGALFALAIGFLFGYFTGKVIAEKKAKKNLLV